MIGPLGPEVDQRNTTLLVQERCRFFSSLRRKRLAWTRWTGIFPVPRVRAGMRPRMAPVNPDFAGPSGPPDLACANFRILQRIRWTRCLRDCWSNSGPHLVRGGRLTTRAAHAMVKRVFLPYRYVGVRGEFDTAGRRSASARLLTPHACGYGCGLTAGTRNWRRDYSSAMAPRSRLLEAGCTRLRARLCWATCLGLGRNGRLARSCRKRLASLLCSSRAC